jgi:hypothetical protein
MVFRRFFPDGTMHFTKRGSLAELEPAEKKTGRRK